MKNFMYGFLLAMQFLTRIPIPLSCPWNKETSKWALRSYPVVGLLLGTVITVITLFLNTFIPEVMLTLVIITLWVWLTGGLHLDGWMDVADAMGSNASVEKKWQIMKDPHVGSFGILALVFLLSWKAIFLHYIMDISFEHIYVFLVILSLSRLNAVLLLFVMPTAKQEGLAYEWKKHICNSDILIAVIPVFVIFLIFPSYLFLFPAYLLFIVVFGLWVKHTFKGINGDILGTAIEGGELWGLAMTWIFFSFVMG
ncbi:adenosylcobinamide-GDP ribazoletransferase [Evansella sp. AB-rgal1]|uniref:adenosylcobinamide-GDP ribazoletransferase n=1 Tax=Evansella sp. AB-rgal1 TaxID=3242696 RepID=UPI00359D7D56